MIRFARESKNTERKWRNVPADAGATMAMVTVITIAVEEATPAEIAADLTMATAEEEAKAVETAANLTVNAAEEATEAETDAKAADAPPSPKLS